MKRTLGTCYYPEHWPRATWEEDAARMAALGLTWVRIGEFAWSRIEPASGDFRWDWLDEAIEVLGAAGLKVVLGTPTATPPRWVCEKHPDMFAVDAQGRPRGFGSRRHYCFSHDGYLDECRRIVTEVAKRYGRNPHVAAWQTDNEYGCHDTILSYSNAARQAFRGWLRARYPGQGNDGDIDALNAAWGNVFWSMEYDDFDQIDLPNLTVTEPNPAHVQAFRRFSSDQVVRFNRAQAEIIRKYSDAPISHNFMGRITDFDHFAVGEDLEIATWDSYPLGFLEDRVGASPENQRHYARQGDPDFQAFHHDLYRAVGRGRWWVMEQQPGPVNWAPYNPAPLPGMVRLWTWEAFAHGAEAVCYFRWRQAPFAQEQLHAGLLRPDSVIAPGYVEAEQVAQELADAPDVSIAQAPVALIFDYDAAWAWQVQPQGQGMDYFGLVFDLYRAFRRAGVTVDILPPTQRDFTGYRLVAAPGMMTMPSDLKTALSASGAEVLIGPRSAARDGDFTIPVPLPPAWPSLDVTVSRLETLRPDMPILVAEGGAVKNWFEHLEGGAETIFATEQGIPVTMRSGSTTYCGGWGDDAFFDRLVKNLCERAEIDNIALPMGVRLRDTGAERFWFNHNPHDVEIAGKILGPAGVVREPLA
ncbi:beta-galactosidase [Marivita sp. XM-24bin2]|jgi:beta-galactosidase|uniref:beta-galactosidase n=1 Tax=unclassified Marivita TaxID=2632480 RepID=UPI000D7A83C9|nr:beta-galactosidase [Marivita sp. XM-24bin2]PWL34285.1 MAG: beta-galactosidase [Marivita sp. XM-24bin2]